MWILGLILIVLAIVLFFVRQDQQNRFDSLRAARSVTAGELQQLANEVAAEIGAGSWQEYVKVRGTIQCDRPIISELKQMPCVHYSMAVRREYEETVTRTDSEGNKTQSTERNSETVANNSQSVPFVIQDATEQLAIDPEGADLETVKVLDEFRPEATSSGLISFGRFSRAISVDSPQSRRHTLGYHYSESILPLERSVVVVGLASDRHGKVTLQKPTEAGKQFIIALKNDEDLLKSANTGRQVAFYGMIASLVLGVVLIVLDLVA